MPNNYPNEALAWINLQQNQAYETLISRRNDSFWQASYALRKNKPELEVYLIIGGVVRLAQSQARYLAGQKPSKFYK